MRKIFSYFPILIAGLLSTATLLSACGDDNDDPAQPSVTLPDGASTDITCYGAVSNMLCGYRRLERRHSPGI